MNPDRAREIVGNFDKQVLVIGDVMLDRWISGSVKRFSPEAPSCPVLDGQAKTSMLGGAGNVAINLNRFGAKCVRLVGYCGDDPAGKELRWILQNCKQIDDQLIVCAWRITTEKTRYLSDGRHLLRHDVETTEPPSEQYQKQLLNNVRDMARICAGIVVADYDKGVITQGTIRAIFDIAKVHGIPVFIDPKKDHWEHFRGAEVVKPNEVEAYAALGIKPGSCPVEDVGDRLLKYTRAKAVIITRGAAGMVLFEKGGECGKSIPTPVKVVDVSGAGDTAMAALALARIAGATWGEAMELANTASGIAVTKPGTSTVPKDELLSRYGE